jgi:dihydroneopterin aldolase
VELVGPYSASTPTQDDLAEVVDYDFIREVIAKRVAQGHIVLQETLCDDLMRELIAHPQVQAVRLSSCKPDVYPDCEAVGVEIFQIKPVT